MFTGKAVAWLFWNRITRINSYLISFCSKGYGTTSREAKIRVAYAQGLQRPK